jgi:hypothetical protein
MRTVQPRLPEQETRLLEEKILRNFTLGAKDVQKIQYFLKNIDKHECFKEVLIFACIRLSARALAISMSFKAICHVPSVKLNINELTILSLLDKHRKILGLPKKKEVLFSDDEE